MQFIKSDTERSKKNCRVFATYNNKDKKRR